MEFIDGGRTERLRIAESKQLRPSGIQRVKSGNTCASLSDRVWVVLVPAVEKIISGQHPPAGGAVNPVGAFVILQSLVRRRSRERAVWIVRSRNVFQELGRRRRPCSLRNHSVRKNALCGAGASWEIIRLACSDAIAEFLGKLAGKIRTAHSRGDRVSVLIDGGERACNVRQVAAAILERRNRDLSCIDSLGRSGALVIRK